MATQTSLNVAPHPNKPGTDIPLPKWNDFSSVVSYLTSIVAVGVGLVAAFQPGFKEPAAVQAAIPAVALVIATGAQIINAWSHRHAHNLAAVALIQRGNPVLPAPPRKTVIQAQGELASERTQGTVATAAPPQPATTPQPASAPAAATPPATTPPPVTTPPPAATDTAPPDPPPERPIPSVELTVTRSLRSSPGHHSAPTSLGARTVSRAIV